MNNERALTKEKEHDRPYRIGGQGNFPKYYWKEDVASAVKILKEELNKRIDLYENKQKIGGFKICISLIDECFPAFKEDGDE